MNDNNETRIYQRPKLSGPDEKHVVGKTGRTTKMRMDTLERLLNATDDKGNAAPRISKVDHDAGKLYVAIVQRFYADTSAFSRLSDEAPRAGADGDPIRLYVKGRRVYKPTQKPRNVARARTGFDGWTVARCNALQEMRSLRRTIARMDPEARKALFALTIDADEPGKDALSVAAYSRRRFGYQNAKTDEKVIAYLKDALAIIFTDYGEVIEYDEQEAA